MEEQKSPVVSKVVKYARKGKCEKMVNVLRENEECVNSTDEENQSALFHAALNGHKKCLKELLKRGADPNQVSTEGNTPCHAAALGGKGPCFPKEINIVRKPITGVRLYLEGMRNVLSYHLHDANCQRRCLECLICFGGDLRMTNKMHEDAKDIAKREKKASIVETISKYNQLQAMTSNSTEAEDEQAGLQTPFGYFQSKLLQDKVSSLYCISQEMGKFGPSFSQELMPEVGPDEIELVSTHCQNKTVDGSLWTRGFWKEGVLVTVRQMLDKGERKKNKKSIMCVEYFLREMDTLRMMHHPHLVTLMGVCSGPLEKDMFLVLEPLQAGSLYSMLHLNDRKFSNLEAFGIILDITAGITYLHNILELAHCIISSHAVHLSPKGGGKLCNVFCCQPPATRVPGVFCAALRLYLPWMAPELMQTRIATFESDIFSIGVLMWELWSGNPPWPGVTPPQLGRAVAKDGQRLPLTNKHSLVAPLLKTCFGPSSARLPAAQLLSQVNYLKMTQFYST